MRLRLVALLVVVTMRVAMAQSTGSETAATEVVVAAPEPKYVAPTLRDRIGRIWAPVFVDGALRTTLRGEHIVAEFIAMLDAYVAERYPAR